MLDTGPDFELLERDTRSCPPSHAHRAQRNHLAGESAEACVARHYQEMGCHLLASRWRCDAGEIDLILRDGATYVFVEVKKSRDFDRAYARITPKQVMRIFTAAEIYVSGTPEGAFADMRFDAALLNAQGQISIVEGGLV